MKEENKFLFDGEKFIVGSDHSVYSLDYEIFRSDVDTSEMNEKEVEKLCKVIEKKTIQACFSNFKSCYADFLKKTTVRANRLRFFCEVKKHNKTSLHLNKEEIEKWVELCQKNKVMPMNIGRNFIDNGIYDVHFENLSMEMLYVYLCFGRYVQEEPFFVKGVLYLMKSHKMGFFSSVCLASYYQVTNSGHHVLPISRDYRISQMPQILNDPKAGEFGNEFDLISAAKLANFVNGGDKEKLIKDWDNLPYFELHSKISKYWDKSKPHSYKVPRDKLRSRRLESILKSGNLHKPLVIKNSMKTKSKVDSL
jgi:hypothetical protein